MTREEFKVTGSIPDEVAFFDIGNTLASVAVSASGDQIENLTVLPDVPPVLATLRERGVRLGIISDRGSIPAKDVKRALAAADLWDFFTPKLVIYGKKNSPQVFELATEAAEKADSPDTARLLLFVGEDSTEREQALRAGFLVASNPRFALSVLDEARGSEPT